MDLYGCTDFRGRLAKRGRGRHAPTNQVIAGYHVKLVGLVGLGGSGLIIDYVWHLPTCVARRRRWFFQ